MSKAASARLGPDAFLGTSLLGGLVDVATVIAPAADLMRRAPLSIGFGGDRGAAGAGVERGAEGGAGGAVGDAAIRDAGAGVVRVLGDRWSGGVVGRRAFSVGPLDLGELDSRKGELAKRAN